MKNLFKLLLAAFVLFSAASCDILGGFGNLGNDDNGGNTGGGNNDQVEFVIEVSGITTSGAVVAITPSSDDTYYFDVVEKAYYDSYSNKSQFLADYVAEIKAYIDELNEYGYGVSFADFVSSGYDSYDFDGLLDANTEYVAIAFGLSVDGVATTVPTAEAFKTLGNGGNTGGGNDDPSQNTFSISVTEISSTSANVAVTPSNNDTYYFDIVDKAFYDSYSNKADLAADYVAYLQETAAEYAALGYDVTLADLLSSGNDSYYFDGILDPNTDYYAVAFGISANGTVTTDVTAEAFTTTGTGASTGGSTDFVYGYYSNYGDYYGTSAANWYIDLYTESTDDVLVVEVMTAISASEFTGSYNFASTYAAGTAVAGDEDSEGLWGSLIGVMAGDGYLSDYNLIKSGSVVISKSGSDYSIVLDSTGENGQAVKISYTGVLEEWDDYSLASASAKKALKRIEFRNLSSVAKIKVAKKPFGVSKLSKMDFAKKSIVIRKISKMVK